jgi:ATP-dependent Lon protease
MAPFIERETSARIRDISLDADLDLSWISYVATANDDAGLPPYIKDRFRIVRLPAPTLAHLVPLAANVLRDIAVEQSGDARWAEELDPDELAVIGHAWERQKFSIRALQKIVSATLNARAGFAMRH